MSLTANQRRELAAAGNRLKAQITIAPGELGPNVIEHIRRAFSERELLKVRVATDERSETADAARQLAAAVPCELVQMVGRVLLLYRAKPAEGAAE
jgi:RNA-binding protein